MIDCITKALELEKQGVLPYTIENQVFKSNRTYPTCIHTHDNVNKQGDMIICCLGDTILEMNSKNGKPFKFKFTSNPEVFASDKDGYFRFENALPSLFSPFMKFVDVGDNVIDIEYEFYGPEDRKKLANTEYEEIEGSPGDTYGVKVPIQGTMYQVYGNGMNACHIATYVKS